MLKTKKGNLKYANEKFQASAEALSGRSMTNQDAVYYRALGIHTLTEADFAFDSECGKEYLFLIKRVSTHRSSTLGAYFASAHAMSDMEAIFWLSDFYRLAIKLDHYAINNHGS